ncbi:MAG: chemotaxis protein CheW, partial [bacterium]|nr:chemotaxis protein CheW [bacterium]
MNNNYIEQKKNTYLYFQVGQNKYAINTTNVLEIVKLPALDYPQKLPNNIIGLLKYNNFVINIIDLRFYLNVDVTPYTTHSELLIVKTDEVILGIVTDSIIGILPFDTSLIDQIPYADSKMIIESLYKYNNETISIVNVYALENILKQHDEQSIDVDVTSLFPTDAESQDLMKKRALAISEKAVLRFATEDLCAKDKYISFNLDKDFYCLALN